MRIIAQTRSGSVLPKILLALAIIGVLWLLFTPALTRPNRASRKRMAKRIQCVSNLKQFGVAATLWANDHGDEFSWVSTNATGSRAFIDSPQVFRHFLPLSDELETPKLLACPVDNTRDIASGFAKFSNTNLSYFLGLDANPSNPRHVMSGDRNIAGSTLSNGFLRLFTPTNDASWTTDMHLRVGNIGLADGSAQQVTDQRLRQQMVTSELPLIRLAIP